MKTLYTNGQEQSIVQSYLAGKSATVLSRKHGIYTTMTA